MVTEGIKAEIREGLCSYSKLTDMPSRMSLGVRLLSAFQKLELAPGGLVCSNFSGEDLFGNEKVMGGLQYHFDLASRTTVSDEEMRAASRYGFVQVAEHRDLPGVPVGAALAVPTIGAIGRRSELAGRAVPLEQADTLLVFALATHPARLGAAAALMRAMSTLSGDKALVAFSPLTGLRAQMILLADKSPDDEELAGMLQASTMPGQATDHFADLLRKQSQRFARCKNYAIGNFHRHMGAKLVAVGVGADPKNCDAMWTRANFKYPEKLTA